VSDLEHSDSCRKITSAIISLGHSLDLTVIAEGVERKGHRQLLRDQGCDLLQGLLFSRPLSQARLEAALVNGASPAVGEAVPPS